MKFETYKILLVDDDMLFCKMYKRLLQKEFGVKVHFVKDPLEALEYLKNGLPDLIVLDMEMPKMDGYTFMLQLRSLEATRKIPVVASSSLQNKSLVAGLAQLKILDYIVKSEKPDLFLERIGKVLGKIEATRKRDLLNKQAKQ